MADDISSEFVKAAEQAARAVQTGRNMAKAAGKAAAGNFAGAAADLLKDENTRRILLAALAFLLLITVMVSSVLPLSIFEGIQSGIEAARESFESTYYAGGGGNLLKALWSFASSLFSGWWSNALASAEPGFYSELDGLVISDSGAPGDSTYQKLEATKEKYELRRNQITEAVTNSGTAIAARDSLAYSLFCASFDPSRDVFAGCAWDLSGCLSEMSDLQALSLMVLNGIISGSSPSRIRMSDYVKWLGYEGPGRVIICIDVLGSTVSLPAWTGTYMPQYLADEAKASALNAESSGSDYRESLASWSDSYGAAAMDAMLKVRVEEPVQAGEPEIAYRLKGSYDYGLYGDYLSRTDICGLVERYGGSQDGRLDVSSPGYNRRFETEEGYVDYSVSFVDRTVHDYSWMRVWVNAGDINEYYRDYTARQGWYRLNGYGSYWPKYWNRSGYVSILTDSPYTVTETYVSVSVYEKYRIVPYVSFVSVTPRNIQGIIDLTGLTEHGPGGDYFSYAEKNLEEFRNSLHSPALQSPEENPS